MRLIDTLMVLAAEQAGAEDGLLILPRGNELRIEAEGTCHCGTRRGWTIGAIASGFVNPEVHGG
jgi:hypothetical protein